MPTVKDMMLARMNQPNILVDVEDNFKHIINDCEWEMDPIMACVNPGKHMSRMNFSELSELETHVKNCFGFEGKLRMKKKKEKGTQLSVKKLEIH